MRQCPFLVEYDPYLFRFKHPQQVGTLDGYPVWSTDKLSEEQWIHVRVNQHYGIGE